jgi:5-methylcytosine-specific restriction endonuclease McrA
MSRSQSVSTRRSGSSKSIYPIADRSPYISQDFGGSFGYRGAGWDKVRLKALAKAGYRSQVSGVPGDDKSLIVDHIVPYRIAGKFMNDPLNLRITDIHHNAAVDNAGKEFKPLRNNPR